MSRTKNHRRYVSRALPASLETSETLGRPGRRWLAQFASFGARLTREIVASVIGLRQQWVGRSSSPRSAARRRTFCLTGELLESRQMLSALPVWVSNTWADAGGHVFSPVAGDSVYPPAGETAPHSTLPLTFGSNAFSDVQSGVNNVGSGGTVYVLPGTYQGEVVIQQPLTLSGAQAGLNPNPTAPLSSNQTIIEPASTDSNGAVIYIASSNVTINGVTVEGSAAGSPSWNEVDGIASFEGVGGIVLENNIVQHTTRAGIDFENYYNTNDAVTSGNTISDNLIQSLDDNSDLGVGVLLADNFYADVTANVIANVQVGVQVQNYNQSLPGATASIADNAISADRTGVLYNLFSSNGGSQQALPFAVNDNTITASVDPASLSTPGDTISDGSGTASLDSLLSPASSTGITIQDGILTKTGAGTSILSDSGITGITGVNVAAGTLILPSSSTIIEGASLTVGQFSTSLFAAPATVSSGSLASLIEPFDNPSSITTPAWAGMEIASVSGSASATFMDNSIDGSGAASYATTSFGYVVWNTPTTGSVTIKGNLGNANNSVTGVDVGVWVHNYDSGYSSTTGAATVTLSGVNMTASQLGVYVQDDPLSGSDPAVSATISNSHITGGGGGSGIEVSGGNASAVISGSSVSNFATGILFTAGGAGSVSSNNFGAGTSNATDLTVGTTAGVVSIGDGNQFAGTNYYIQDLSSTPQNFNLSGYTQTTFAGFNAATNVVTGNLPTFYGIETKIVDYLDYPADGYIRIKSGYDFVAHSSEVATPGAVQRGINAAQALDIVEVQAGAYVGEVQIDQPLTLSGAQAGLDPNPTAPATVSQSIIEPDPTQPDVGAVLYIACSNVTVEGLTVDGSTSSSGDAWDGIASFEGVGNILLQDNIVQHTVYAGIDLENYNNGGGATSGNTIHDNLVQNLDTAGSYAIGVLLGYNFYADVTDNVTANVRTGVQLQNFFHVNPGATGSVSGNTLAAYGTGLFYNLSYDSNTALGDDATPIPVSGNTITAIDYLSTPKTTWSGILIASVIGSQNVAFTDNKIDGSAATSADFASTAGYDVWNTTAGSVTIAGVQGNADNSTSGVNVGVWVHNYDGGYPSPTGAAAVALNGVNIAASQLGVYVQDDPLSGSDPAVSATITSSFITALSGGTGVKVSGGNASASITLSEVTGGAAGIDLEGGALSAVTNNWVVANSGPAVLIGSTTASSLKIQNNDLSSQGSLVLKNSSAATLDAAENYFSNSSGLLATPAAVAPYISGTVYIEPIVTGGTWPTVGFLPNLMADLAVDITSGTASPTEGATFTLNLAPANASSNSTTLKNWTVSWGDGSPSTFVDLTNPSTWAAVGYNSTTHTLTHVYQVISPPTYVISATSTDENGNTATSNALNVVVSPATFHVINFSPNANGFDATFNRTADIAAIHLYSSSLGHALYPADLVVTDVHGTVVPGSLVWNAATNTASWVATGTNRIDGSILSATNSPYTVTLLSGSGGWQDTNNNLLDGSDNGGTNNYQTTFSVAAPTGPVVTLACFACGPGQSVTLPARTPGSELPISISNGAGVTSIQLTLSFNPNLLSVTGALAGGGLPAGWVVGSDLSQASSGQVVLTASGTTPLGSSLLTCFEVTANVPTTAAYGASDLLAINSLIINGGAMSGTANRAVHKAAYLGDASGNQDYGATDVSLIDRVDVELDTGFDAYPLTDPVIIGDVNLSGRITPQDGGELGQAAVDFVVPDLPALPVGHHPVPVSHGLDPLVSVASGVAAIVGQSVDVPVTINGPAGVYSFDLAFAYDTTQLSLSPQNVRLGALTAAGWSLAVHVDAKEGVVVVSGAATASLPAGTGEILDLDFQVLGSAVAGLKAVSIVGVNGGGLDDGAMPLTAVAGSVDVAGARVAASDGVLRASATMPYFALSSAEIEAIAGQWYSQQWEQKRGEISLNDLAIAQLLAEGLL